MQGTEQLRPLTRSTFEGNDIISIGQFEAGGVDLVMEEARAMANMIASDGRSDLLRDKIVANLFFQPSTRTFLSLEAAAKRLGAGTIAVQDVDYSSITKGESFADTVTTVGRYADVISLRDKVAGQAAVAAAHTEVPVINAGDGVGEHPTQALLDLYTICDEFGSAEGLTVSMVGDLKYGRTVHSLARLLALYGAKLNLVSPAALPMPSEILEELRAKDVEVTETTELQEVLDSSDVLYVTRVQREYFDNEAAYNAVKGSYVVDRRIMQQVGAQAILMHPLPRVDEIHPEVDEDPRARYFQQVENGVYVRMAALALVLGRSIRSRGVH